jgi:hypothetical protein
LGRERFELAVREAIFQSNFMPSGKDIMDWAPQIPEKVNYFLPNPKPTPEQIEEDRKYRALLKEKVREISLGKKIS